MMRVSREIEIPHQRRLDPASPEAHRTVSSAKRMSGLADDGEQAGMY